MAKSVGNIRSLAGAVDYAGRDALILYFVSGHYRQPIAFSEELLDNAARGVARIREAGRRLVAGPSPEDMAPLKERFFAALADDFNTPEALAAVYDWVREANRRDEGTVGDADLREMLDVLALANLLDEDAAEGPDAEALALAQQREEARAAGDYACADALRDELLERGWQVRDGSAGPELLPRG
jgi:cysteinyl-tRNA synthetase